MFKLIPLARVGIPSAADIRAADSRACAEMPPRRGTPRTAREWTALVKVASGETDITPMQSARLAALGLIDTTSGSPALTRHGRVTLGLPE